MKAFFRNVIPFSAVDGPGNRSVIFLQGCNLNCMYCHNPETISFGLQEGVSELTPEGLLDVVKPYVPFISGLTISGGECTTQPAFLEAFCGLAQKEGIHVLLDSNGLMSADWLQRLMKVSNGFMFDVKMVDADKHRALTGVDNAQILANVTMALEQSAVYEIRTVLFEESDAMTATVTWVAQQIVKAGYDLRYKLILYRNHGVRTEFQTQLPGASRAYGASLFKLAKDLGVQTVILV